MQQLHHHRSDGRKDLSAFLPLVRDDGPASLPRRMLSTTLQWVGTRGSGTQGTDVVDSLKMVVKGCEIRLPELKISVHPLVQPDHTNFHPTEPTQGYFRSLGKNGSFVGMKNRFPLCLPGSAVSSDFWLNWWAMLDSDQRPLPCEGNALTN